MNNRSLRVGAALCAVGLAGGGLVACSDDDDTYRLAQGEYCTSAQAEVNSSLEDLEKQGRDLDLASERWRTDYAPGSRLSITADGEAEYCIEPENNVESADHRISNRHLVDNPTLSSSLPTFGEVDTDGDRNITVEELTKALGDPVDLTATIASYAISHTDKRYEGVSTIVFPVTSRASLSIKQKYLDEAEEYDKERDSWSASNKPKNTPAPTPTSPKDTPAPAPAPASTETRALAYDGDGNYSWATGNTSNEALDGALSRMDDPDNAGYATSTDCIALMYDPVDGSYFTGTGKSILAAQMSSDHHTVGAEPVATYCAGDSEPQVAS